MEVSITAVIIMEVMVVTLIMETVMEVMEVIAQETIRTQMAVLVLSL